MYTAQKTRLRKWNDFLNRIERATQTHKHFIVCFEGWLYHLELLKRPKRYITDPKIETPDKIFWEMLNDQYRLGWLWHWNPEF